MTEKLSPIYLTDRTSIETDWLCGMRYWWYKKEGGGGIVPLEEVEALSVGKDVHEDLAAIAEMEDISHNAINRCVTELSESLRGAIQTDRQRELLSRRLGWIAAYALFIEPKVREEYETISVEGEIILDRDPLWIAVTPDRILRHREGKYLVYREYKTAKSINKKWINSWPYAVQIHLGIKAVEEELEQKVAFGQVMGLVKGDDRDGKLRHPYVWAYRNTKTGVWDHEYQRGSEWELAPVWEYPGGIFEWVVYCGEEIAQSQFPHSPPIFCNERLLKDLINRRIDREVEIRLIEDRCHDEPQYRPLYFEQRFSKCRPSFGDPCPYLAACHNATINQDPLASGLFVRRTPHHEIEVQFGNDD